MIIFFVTYIRQTSFFCLEREGGERERERRGSRERGGREIERERQGRRESG